MIINLVFVRKSQLLMQYLYFTLSFRRCKNAKLYCIFIDYERAFDSIIRDALWLKLIGISSKMIVMIKAIYKDVKSCVKLSTNMEMSQFFNVSVGLKQEELLSPLLFILFINDIFSCINVNSLVEKDLNELCMYLMLFADDIVLFTTDPVSLEAQIDNIYQYSLRWGLEINVKKTKLCIFEKRKQNHGTEFLIENQKIDIVDNFTYLGINFKYNGSL